MGKPIARGVCESCNTEFIIWKASSITVIMQESPRMPIVAAKCPACSAEITHNISFKDATIFHLKGVTVKHSYDDKNDLQPITNDEIDKFLAEFIENPQGVIEKFKNE